MLAAPGRHRPVVALAVILASVLATLVLATLTGRAGSPAPTARQAGRDQHPAWQRGLGVADEPRRPPRIVLWGDSLAWEARTAFTRTAQRDGPAVVLTRTFAGTALCDWLPDIPAQLRRWHPDVAVLAFSGNALTPCMRGRTPTAAYLSDATTAIGLLTAARVHVYLVDAPPGRRQQVDPAGLTALGHVWRAVTRGRPDAGVIGAGRAVSDHGRWTATLPCLPAEPCRRDGTTVVRGPDGIHFCPVAHPLTTACPVRSPGAERFGTAMAEAAVRTL